ncbi:MAG: ATP-grasp domain-containing protein [archaeon]
MRIAITFNLITGKLLENSRVDTIAELDNMTTINAIKKSLESAGHTAFGLNCNDDAYGRLYKMRKKIDMVFNIFEGLKGESRESQVPAMLEMMQIPYTGSDPLSLALCLDKVMTKEILIYHGIPTPKFQVFSSGNEKIDSGMKFPMICKLIHEGSSKGMSKKSVVENESELRKQVKFLLAEYREDILVEEFIEGTEYSIGIIGNGEKIKVLPITERFYLNPKAIALFEPDEAVIPLLKKMHKKYLLEQKGQGGVRPAQISKKLEEELKKMAVDSYNACNCRDWCRMEIRMNRKTGKLYIIELNPIAGIDPSYILPKQANLAGMSYADLINAIVNFASERYRLKRNL